MSYVLRGGSPHDLTFACGKDLFTVKEEPSLLLRATMPEIQELGSLVLQIGGRTDSVVQCPVHEASFGPLDDPSGELTERLVSLPEKHVVVGSAIAARAVRLSGIPMTAQVGWPAGFTLKSRLEEDNTLVINPHANRVLIPQPMPTELPNGISVFNTVLAMRPPLKLVNYLKDPYYVRLADGSLQCIPQAAHPLEFIIQDTQIGAGQEHALSRRQTLTQRGHVPIMNGRVTGIKNAEQLVATPPDVVPLVYSDMLVWLARIGSPAAGRAVCGWRTERHSDGSQLPVIQSLARMSQATLAQACHIGF